MRIEYINPFVEASQLVLEEMLHAKVVRGEMYIRRYSGSAKGVTAIVGLAGNVEGRIIFDMDMETAIKVASSMLVIMGMEEVSDLDDLGKSSLTELANTITGQAITKLSDLGFVFDITPPALFTGEKMFVTDDKVEILIVPIDIENVGSIELNMVIRDRMHGV